MHALYLLVRTPNHTWLDMVSCHVGLALASERLLRALGPIAGTLRIPHSGCSKSGSLVVRVIVGGSGAVSPLGTSTDKLLGSHTNKVII